MLLRCKILEPRMSLVGHFVRSTRFRRSRHVRFAPFASEPSHHSNSTRCAITGCEQVQQTTPLLDHLVRE
jgi:hypothetical protein